MRSVLFVFDSRHLMEQRLFATLSKIESLQQSWKLDGAGRASELWHSPWLTFNALPQSEADVISDPPAASLETTGDPRIWSMVDVGFGRDDHNICQTVNHCWRDWSATAFCARDGSTRPIFNPMRNLSSNDNAYIGRLS